MLGSGNHMVDMGDYRIDEQMLEQEMREERMQVIREQFQDGEIPCYECRALNFMIWDDDEAVCVQCGRVHYIDSEV